MTQIFWLYFGKFLIVYFDDILIFSKTQEEHLGNFRLTVGILPKKKLYLNIKKYSFIIDNIIFFGFIVFIIGLRVDL